MEKIIATESALSEMFGVEFASPVADAAPLVSDIICERCKGSGKFVGYAKTFPCRECGGEGVKRHIGKSLADDDCRKCCGTGWWRPGYKCFSCTDGKVKPAEKIANMAAVVELLNKAVEKTTASRLKGKPHFNFLAGDLHVSLEFAGPRSKYPGSMYLSPAKGDGWYGRIDQSGSYDRNRQIPSDTQTAIVAALQEFAKDPRAAALAYARKMRCCCFCSKPLLDPVSVYVGYGPVCAERWSLPHRASGLTTEEVRVADAAATA